VKAGFKNGKSGYFRIFAIFDSKQHLFWWLSLPGLKEPSPDEIADDTTSFLDSHVVRFTSNKIVVFWPTYGFSLRVLSSDRNCSSEEECWNGVYRALDEKLLGDYFQIGHGIVAIDLKKALGDNFAVRKEDRLSAAPRMFMPQIDSIDHVRGEWKIRVQSPDKEVGAVVLNDKFEVIKASHLGNGSGAGGPL
jgi:hypothetical protein